MREEGSKARPGFRFEMTPLSTGSKGHETTLSPPTITPIVGLQAHIDHGLGDRAPVWKSEKSEFESFFLHFLAVNLRQTAKHLVVSVIITHFWVKCGEKRFVVCRGFVMIKRLAHKSALAVVSP